MTTTKTESRSDTQSATRSAPRKTSADKSKRAPQDAIAMLKADHEEVSQLFAEYEKTRSVANRKALVAEVCAALGVHMQIEEEVFYPAVRDALKDKLLVPEATVEHAGVKDLLAQLQHAEAGTEMYDAKVKVLSEYVKHHVKEEQEEMFPKVKASSLDTAELGARMLARREDLMARARA